MKIEGLFSSEQLKQYPVVLEPLASVSITYGNIYDEEKKLRLKIMPDFNMVMECFIKTRVPIIKSLQLDICLSLFFNPYFNSFYEYIISKDDCKNIFNKYKRNYLIKRMLNFLSSNIYYEIIVARNGVNNKIRDYYIKEDIYKKSNELLKLLR